MNEDAFLREQVTNLLKTGLTTITFTKTDGTVREMLCSLNESLVKNYEKKTDAVKQTNNTVQSVFDIEKQEWRSFRWDNLISFKAYEQH